LTPPTWARALKRLDLFFGFLGLAKYPLRCVNTIAPSGGEEEESRGRGDDDEI
jgi:hypothetical protein